MKSIEITFDTVTWFFDACIVSKGIATQAKSLDECIKNLSEALSLAEEKSISLNKFSISYEDSYVSV